MTEATDCWAVISSDSCVWTEVCCSYGFPLIVSSVCLGGTGGRRRLDWDVTGPLSRRCSAVFSTQWQDVMSHSLQAAGSLGCSDDQLPTNEEPLKSSVTYKTHGDKRVRRFISIHIYSVWVLLCEHACQIQRTVLCSGYKFCWMKGGQVCSFGIFNGELVYFPLEVLRIAWPFGDWPGTLDTSCLFED